jgi:hypothetical protein
LQKVAARAAVLVNVKVQTVKMMDLNGKAQVAEGSSDQAQAQAVVGLNDQAQAQAVVGLSVQVQAAAATVVLDDQAVAATIKAGITAASRLRRAPALRARVADLDSEVLELNLPKQLRSDSNLKEENLLAEVKDQSAAMFQQNLQADLLKIIQAAWAHQVPAAPQKANHPQEEHHGEQTADPADRQVVLAEADPAAVRSAAGRAAVHSAEAEVLLAGVEVQVAEAPGKEVQRLRLADM